MTSTDVGRLDDRGGGRGRAGAWIVLGTLAGVTTTPLCRHVPVRRLAGLLAGLALGAAVLAGCGSENATTDCGLDSCTVTFNRGVDARASILGVEARLVGVDGDRVTIEVAGERLTLTVGQQGTEIGGLYASIESADADQVVVRIGRNPG